MATESNESNPLTPHNGPLPIYQQKQAEEAHLNPNEPAKEADAGTPSYGDFGKAENAGPSGSTSKNDGSNDNPDEFSEFRKPDQAAIEGYGTDPDAANPEHQQGHVDQNQATDEVIAAQHDDTDKRRAAWSDDDARYAGGHREASWEENNAKEHSND